MHLRIHRYLNNKNNKSCNYITHIGRYYLCIVIKLDSVLFEIYYTTIVEKTITDTRRTSGTLQKHPELIENF